MPLYDVMYFVVRAESIWTDLVRYKTAQGNPLPGIVDVQFAYSREVRAQNPDVGVPDSNFFLGVIRAFETRGKYIVAFPTYVLDSENKGDHGICLMNMSWYRKARLGTNDDPAYEALIEAATDAELMKEIDRLLSIEIKKEDE